MLRTVGFNPRPLCRERLFLNSFTIANLRVSIHAPYAGSDHDVILPGMSGERFQSTPPMQGATGLRRCEGLRQCVSIHAPYAGSDVTYDQYNPSKVEFQSTPPMQGATSMEGGLHWIADSVSIHAPYAGSDYYGPDHLCRVPVSIHAPYAGSDFGFKVPVVIDKFQSTPPMQGATLTKLSQQGLNYGFNPRPLCRERRWVQPLFR